MINWIKEKFELQYKELKALKIAFTRPEQIKTKGDKLAFIMLAANYDNLGDIAITRAQEEYLKKILPQDYEVVIVPHDKTFNVFLSMKKLVNNYTIITLIGGGNSGTLYEFIEWPRRFILKHFSRCKIISFPQSVFYGDKPYELKYKKEFIKLAKLCTNVSFFARERLSYNKYKDMLGDEAKVFMVPDIVFSLKDNSIKERTGACMIFRKDKEKSITSVTEEKLSLIFHHKYGKVSYLDTCDVHVTGNGYDSLQQFIDILKTKKLIVTDRLHGMILAFVTNTPCIALDNNNHKIKSTYNTWLRDDGRIRLLERIDDLDSIFFNDQHIDIEKNFCKLKEVILK